MTYWGDSDDDAVAAVELANALDRGWRPEPAASVIRLFPDEQFLHSIQFRLEEFSGQTVTYGTGAFVALGSPLFAAASIGGSLLFNAARKRKAQAQAAPQWRVLATGMMHVTNMRLGLQGSAGWHEIAFDDIRAAECLDDGVLVYLPNASPLKIVVAWPAYLYVLLNFLVHGAVVHPTISDDIRSRAAATGRNLPAPTHPQGAS